MKKKSLKKIAVAALSLALMSPAAVFAGTWEKDGDNWKYKKDDGQYAEYEWVQDTDGTWYYCKRWGTMETNHLIDDYYVGADGRMVSKDDTANPLNQADIYGTCYMSVDRFQDQGDYYQAKVTLYDSSFGTGIDFWNYSKGDKFWIEAVGDYGKVKSVSLSAYGDAYMEVSYGTETFVYDGEEVWCCGDGSETPVLRKVKENVDVKIPKNISVISAPGFEQFTLSLDSYLNDSVYKMTPVFNGTTIEKLYDSFINYAG